MTSRLRPITAVVALVVLAAVVSVVLAFLTHRQLERIGLPNPGIYVWGLLHPQPEPGFIGPSLGSLLGTEIIVNSTCWFILLCIGGATIARLRKRKHAHPSDTLPNR